MKKALHVALKVCSVLIALKFIILPHSITPPLIICAGLMLALYNIIDLFDMLEYKKSAENMGGDA